MTQLIEEIFDGKTIYKCPCCGEVYGDLPLCFGHDRPDYYWSVPEEERESRIELQDSLCIIDDHYFHRGELIIPIIDYDDDLVFHIWTTISEENFKKRIELWRKAKRIKESPYFGWLQSHVPTYGNTLHIKTRAWEQKVGYIPLIEVGEENHPLTIDQSNGITFEKAKVKVAMILQQRHK